MQPCFCVFAWFFSKKQTKKIGGGGRCFEKTIHLWSLFFYKTNLENYYFYELHIGHWKVMRNHEKIIIKSWPKHEQIMRKSWESLEKVVRAINIKQSSLGIKFSAINFQQSISNHHFSVIILQQSTLSNQSPAINFLQ